MVSFVWGPGQQTPVHDHTVWGLVGVMRGAELCEEFALGPDGLKGEAQHRVEPGSIDLVSPEVGDLHRVSNALADPPFNQHPCVRRQTSAPVSRHAYDPSTGEPRTFVSGYSSEVMPNLWDRSVE